MDIEISKKQRDFINAIETEVLYGGAAGGGKSYGQLIDALLYALKYTGSKQLILRRTFPELEKSLIRTHLEFYPLNVYKYNTSQHTGRFVNKSLIDFGYCDKESDVYKYQSAEYDVMRFDELTHFTESMYTYLISRVRGANNFPKQIKSSTNPGNIGHQWVKERFIDVCSPNKAYTTKSGTRIFIPAKVKDNKFLLDKDPEYIKRLENLSEDDKKALLYGDWDIYVGKYFTEFNRDVHVIEPIKIPTDWRKYRVLDYGLDMLACYIAAFDNYGRCYVIRELYKDDLIVPNAAQQIISFTNSDEIYRTYAPPDLWNRQKDTGKSIAQLFNENGIRLIRTSNERVAGWMNMKIWLKPFIDETGEKIAGIRIFNSCINLIRCIPAMRHDEKNPNDCALEPHEITHGPDAIRYLLAGRPSPNKTFTKSEQDFFNSFLEKKGGKDALGVGQKMEVF